MGSLITRVILVRHGQSNYNVEKKIQGRSDESFLTEKGREDAQKVAAALGNLKIDGFYCSPLQRAKQTAEVIHRALDNPPPLQVSDRLKEIDLPLWENLKKQEVLERYGDDYRLWKQRPYEFRMLVPTPQGQREHYPVRSLMEQASLFWQEVLEQHQGGTIVVVAHNGINRCLISTAIGIPPQRYHTLQQTNCCINVLNFTGGLGESVQLESFNQTSHLGIELPPPRQPDRGVRLLLVRHGETDWNRESRFQGTIDIPLNETGKEQARKVAEFLKEVKLDFAITSPMLRPKKTAEMILQYHPGVVLQIRPRLSEIGHGLWEGKLQSEVMLEYPDLLRQWKETPELVQMPEGENLQQVWDRAIACWQDLVKEVQSNELKTGIVVAHDAINKVILCSLLGLQPCNFWNIKQGNGAVSVIDYPDGADGMPVVQAINLTSHLGKGILDRTAAGAL